MRTWLAENSIVDTEVALMAKTGVITEFNIIEEPVGVFYVTMRLNWRDDIIHLATRRERDKPRTFMHLGRLVQYIRENFKGVVETRLLLLPETPDTSMPTSRLAKKSNARGKKKTPPKDPATAA